jgi:hypothetical protein
MSTTAEDLGHQSRDLPAPCKASNADCGFSPPAQQLGEVPIIAEDLGVITPDVVELRKAIGAPGMVVLQFAWGSGSANVHLPHNHYENCVCYPGVGQDLVRLYQLVMCVRLMICLADDAHINIA